MANPAQVFRNVKDYGAKGDGITVHADYPRTLHAWIHLADLGSRTILVPSTRLSVMGSAAELTASQTPPRQLLSTFRKVYEDS